MITNSAHIQHTLIDARSGSSYDDVREVALSVNMSVIPESCRDIHVGSLVVGGESSSCALV